MSVIDTYGELEMPEEKTEIEVVEDPVKTIISCYEFLERKLKNEIENKHSWNDLDNYRFAFYETAEKLFEDKEKIKPTYEQINEVLMQLKAKEVHLKELFLSALHNQTELADLIIEKKHTIPLQRIPFVYREDTDCGKNLGLKLKKEKLLLIGTDLKVIGACTLSEGILINHGNISVVGGKNGIYINNGAITIFGCGINGNILINNGLAYETAQYSCTGIYINNRYSNIGRQAKGGIYIDNSKLDEEVKYSGSNRDQKRKPWDKEEPKTIRIDNKTSWFEDKKETQGIKPPTHLKRKLDLKLAEIEFTKELGKFSYQEQIKKVRAFNWKQFEEDIAALANEIKENEQKIK